MADQPAFPRASAVYSAFGPLMHFFGAYLSAREQRGSAAICDFTFGNPHDMPLPAYVDALQRATVPENKDWFAYKLSEPASQRVIAESLSGRFGMPFESEDIAVTTGGFGALSSALFAVTVPGDEVIYSLPPWFNYETLSVGLGLVPVKVLIEPVSFDLDLAAIADAITPRTRVVIVNSPNNPTGKIYPPETLTRLAALLSEASARIGRTIYLLSDEAYNRIVYSEATFRSPVEFYPHAFLAYSYGKTLLAPGQRIGYLAMSPSMPEPERVELRRCLFAAQSVLGFTFANALLQHALPDLERLSIDIPRLERKRDRMIGALRDMGYDIHVPEGAFYLMPKSPWEDDWAFHELLTAHDVFVLPGVAFELPGYFRISLTANEEMIERSLPGFAAAIEQARGYAPTRGQV